MDGLIALRNHFKYFYVSFKLMSSNPYGYEIENIVASVNLNRKLDLSRIAKKYPACEYHPESFPGLIYRLWKPDKIALLIFTSGKMVCAGAKRVESAKKLLRKLIVRSLRDFLVKVHDLNLKFKTLLPLVTLMVISIYII